MKEYCIKFSNGKNIIILLNDAQVKQTKQYRDDKVMDKNGVLILEIFPTDFRIKPADFFPKK